MRSKMILFVCLLVLAACGEPAPTALPVTETAVPPPPTAAPDDPTAPPATAVPAATVVSDATAVASPTTAATAVPTATEITPTAQSLAITQPADNAQLAAGSSLTIAGTAPLTATEPIQLVLEIGPLTLLTETVTVAADGVWTTTVELARSVTGPARLTAGTGSETAVHAVQLLPDANADPQETRIELTRPFENQFAAAGSPLFFEGAIKNGTDQTITIGFLTNECRDTVAEQSFTIEAADAEWNGYIILPDNLEDTRGCAFVSTGTPAGPNWRMVLRPLPLLPTDADEPAILLELGTPTDEPFTAGQRVTLYGAAVNAPEGEIRFSWLDAAGEVLVPQTAVAVDALDFWEIDVTLPADAAGEATIVLAAGEDEDAVVTEISVQIAP